MTGYRALSRNHDFTILWIGETVSTLGSRMSLFTFPLVGYAISGSTGVAAWAEAAHLLGLCGTLLPAGVVVDRLDRRSVMLAASGAGMVLYCSLAVAGLLGVLTVPHLLAVALLTGAVAGLFGPAQTSAIRSVVATDDLPTALSQNQAREHVAGLVGAPLGGLLYSIARWLPFAVDAATYVVSCVTLTRLRTDLSPARTGRHSRIRADLSEGMAFMVRRPFFRVLLAWAGLANLITNATFFLALLRMIQEGHGPARIGLTETAAGLGGILGALLAPVLIGRMATGRLTVLIAWALVPPMIPLIWWSSPLAVGSSLFVLMLLNPAGNAGISSYRIAITPTELQGRVSATSQFVAMSMMPLSPLIASHLLERYGAPVAIAGLVVATAGTALLLTLSRSVRSVPRPAEWPSEAPSAASPRNVMRTEQASAPSV